MSKLCFGDIVVVEENLIGVVVKSWSQAWKGQERSYDVYAVYVRKDGCIKTYSESEVERYMIRHKYLEEEEVEYQRQAVGK